MNYFSMRTMSTFCQFILWVACFRQKTNLMTMLDAVEGISYNPLRSLTIKFHGLLKPQHDLLNYGLPNDQVHWRPQQQMRRDEDEAYRKDPGNKFRRPDFRVVYLPSRFHSDSDSSHHKEASYFPLLRVTRYVEKGKLMLQAGH